DGLAVGGQALGVGERDHGGRDLLEGRLVVVHHVDTAQERLHAQPRGVPGGAGGGQDVVGAGRVVPERDGRVGADEDRAGVADAGGVGGRIPGLDLEVLGRVG